jgi:hypothetical protein
MSKNYMVRVSTDDEKSQITLLKNVNLADAISFAAKLNEKFESKNDANKKTAIVEFDATALQEPDDVLKQYIVDEAKQLKQEIKDEQFAVLFKNNLMVHPAPSKQSQNKVSRAEMINDILGAKNETTPVTYGHPADEVLVKLRAGEQTGNNVDAAIQSGLRETYDAFEVARAQAKERLSTQEMQKIRSESETHAEREKSINAAREALKAVHSTGFSFVETPVRTERGEQIGDYEVVYNMGQRSASYDITVQFFPTPIASGLKHYASAVGVAKALASGEPINSPIIQELLRTEKLFADKIAKLETEIDTLYIENKPKHNKNEDGLFDVDTMLRLSGLEKIQYILNGKMVGGK